MNSTFLWLAIKLLLGRGRQILSSTGWISLAGLVIGVASLVVSMAVISGFESTLQRNVADSMGHIQIQKMTADKYSWQDFSQRVEKLEPQVESATPYLFLEGVLAHKGKLSGVFLHGLDPEQMQKVLGFSSRVLEGKAEIKDEQIPSALIGKGVAKSFSLKVGDEFKIVLPISADLSGQQFKRKLGTLKVAGIVDLGKYEYDQRMIVLPLAMAQRLADVGDRYSGLIFKVRDYSKAREISQKLSPILGSDYRIRDWRDINENLFEAVRIEKVVIFFVIFVIIIAAAFNVATSLYINVIQRYSEIALLKALGLTPKALIKIFSLQGLVLGVIGSALGLVGGLLFALGFTWIEKQFGLIPGSIYKIDYIHVEFRFLDIFSILFTTLLICLVATIAPARKGARLTTVEGLRHE